ncbi:TPM domain-containing protein [Georgenia thermotolerans]|uniref:TPM domain-containing protein n=1 Tax=Georgenia thermotolerans TaxID=527326 RepID=A0A7J5UL45_9MICO|nr:TPM domain-containing protein [Georgenia thermotolerans]KAE8762874.1 TPM domain-containing protein [Georgenia thermotolerans]
MRPVTALRTLAAVALAGLPLLTLAGPAAAEPPQNLTTQVTDTADVLTSAEEQEVQQAIKQVQSDTGQLVYVTFVPDFSGETGEQWAADTATVSGLGPNNILLAVGVDIRKYGIGRHTASPVDQQELQSFTDSEVAPKLGNGDWAGAAITFAQGVGDLSQGKTPGASGGGGGMGAFGTVVVVGLIVILAVGAFLILKRRRETGARRPAGRALPKDHPLNLPTEELAKRAGTALVGADDAIRSSEEELGFAKAQFGLQATDQFTAALAEAKTRAQRAFQLRQQLDDDIPETEPQQRQMYAEILQLTTEIDQTLRAQTEQFAKLRNMQARAPQVLDELDQRATEVAQQIESARVELAELATRYPAATLASIAKNPDQAKALLASARQSVADGRAKVQEGDRATAVTHARVAEQAIGQADTLLKNVHGAGAALAEAGARLDTALASITADVRDANRLAPTDPVVGARRKEAEAAIAQGNQARGGAGDPLAALQRLAAAEAAIDAALAPARAADENNRRAAAQLADRLGRVNSQIQAVSDFIATRRGSVGSEARTRLSEASRLAAEAARLSGSDPAAALQTVIQAEQMATTAQQLAERDANRFDDYSGFGGWGGGYGGGRRGGIDVGSLILGGILLGGGHGGWGGGWGGGGGFGGGGGGFGGGGGGFGGGGGGGGF